MVAINCARDYANMQPGTIYFPCFIFWCLLSPLPPTQVIGPPYKHAVRGCWSLSIFRVSQQGPLNEESRNIKKWIFYFRSLRYCSRSMSTMMYSICWIKFFRLFLNHQWRLVVLLLAFQALAVIETERASVADAAPYRGSVYQYNYSKSPASLLKSFVCSLFFALRNGKGNDALK
jgi:hypothetical protein